MIAYCLVSPLFVMAITNKVCIGSQNSYHYAIEFTTRIMMLLSGFTVLLSGSVAFNNSSRDEVGWAMSFLYVYPPTILFSSIEYGFLHELDQLLQNQNKTEMNVDTWH